MNPYVANAAVEELEKLCKLEVQFAGVRRAVALHPPPYGAVVRTLMEPEGREQNARLLLAGELIQILDVDGEPVFSPEAALAIVDDTPALTAILDARARLNAFCMEQGRVLAICPACGRGQELDLAFYVAHLGMGPWKVTDGRFIAPPTLAWPAALPAPLTRPYAEPVLPIRMLARRPPAPPRAARIDFVLPAARLGLAESGDALTGTLGDVDHAREIEAWRTWAPPTLEQPAERTYWHPDRPGFRAAIRLAVALGELRAEDSAPIEPTPEAIEKLFLADVDFLDLVYTATHDLEVETPPGDEPPCTIHCSCGQAYLPVR